MASGYGVYRDVKGDIKQREYVETVQSAETATKDCDYIRARLPKEDRVFHQWESKPQDVPTFNTADLGEKRAAEETP